MFILIIKYSNRFPSRALNIKIEDYEKYLILLTKASKINLLRHAKHSTSRDFRIKQSNDTVNKEGAEDQLDENNDDSAAEAAEDDDTTEEPGDNGHELELS